MLSDNEAKALTARVEALARRVRVMQILAIGALVVALAGGTAWAASRYLITSTSQIKPSVLAKIEHSVSREPRTQADIPGPRGPIGPAGPAGAPGGSAGGVLAPAGFSASSSDVAMVDQPNAETAGAAVQLPAGYFIANGAVTVSLTDANSDGDYLVTCSLTDSPGSGPSTTTTAQWDALTDWRSFALLVPDTAENTLPLTEAIDSPTSASTLSITCDASTEGPSGVGPLVGPIDAFISSAVTAIQTSGNTQGP
jgi:hypothetical protein